MQEITHLQNWFESLPAHSSLVITSVSWKGMKPKHTTFISLNQENFPKINLDNKRDSELPRHSFRGLLCKQNFFFFFLRKCVTWSGLYGNSGPLWKDPVTWKYSQKPQIWNIFSRLTQVKSCCITEGIAMVMVYVREFSIRAGIFHAAAHIST